MRWSPQRSLLPATIQCASGEGNSRPILIEIQPAKRPSATRQTNSHPGARMARIMAPETPTVHPAVRFTGGRCYHAGVDAFSPDERRALAPYFTELDGPVFALVNLPEVVKGALFARYSRSAKSLRRLFLDEFVGELDMAGDSTLDATIGLARAEELYQRVFFEYGDDSVAQLGGVHLACEQSSNLLTKILEWGRLMSYLEQ